MAFAKLFTGLFAVEDVNSAAQPAHRYETENGEKGKARKRKPQGEQTGPHKKKQCSRAQATGTCNATSDDCKATHYPADSPDSEHVGFTKGATHGPSGRAGHRSMRRQGQNYKTKTRRNVNKPPEHAKNTEWKNNPHQQKAAGGSARGSARPTSGVCRTKNDRQDLQVTRTRFMTQEFKDQNALLVDGRILCRHFLWGRCIKGDDCQLEHVKGYNDLVKEVCKFYIQGLCAKGESCPYMHKSFPCKFFHRKGKCFQGADCRFSHEPLNDVTNELLDAVLKRDSELNELAKKAEQESSVQPEDADESEIKDADRTPDVLLQPLVPNFYKSTDTNAEEEALLCQTEELAANSKQAVPPHSHPPANPDHNEPVCYSVEAILGPQLSKPFPSFFTAPRSQDSAALSSSDRTSSSAHQVPYSVHAVLKSCESVESPTFGLTPAPPTTQAVTYTPKTDSEEITDPPPSSLTQHEMLLDPVNMRDKANKSQEKMAESPSLASGDHKNQRGNMLESLKPAKMASHEVKVEMLHPPVTLAEKCVSSKSKGDMKRFAHLPVHVTFSGSCKSEGFAPLGASKHKGLFPGPPCLTRTSTHPTQLTPQLSVLASDSKASFKPSCPSAGFTRLKGRAAAPAEPGTCSIKSRDSAKTLSESCLHTKKTQSGLAPGTQQHDDMTAETTACKNTPKRPFQSLFSSPVATALQPIDDSVASLSRPPGSIQSSCPALPPADSSSNHPKTAAEPDSAPARSFLRLFASPLSAAALPHMQSPSDCSKTSSCSQQATHSVNSTPPLSGRRASDSQTPLPRQVRAEVKETVQMPPCPDFSRNPKPGREDGSAERVNQPVEQQMKPACSLVSLSETSTSPAPRCNSPSKTHARRQPPHKAEAPASSVFKTLFLRLGPYQQDAEGGEKDRSSAGGVFVKQQGKSKRRRGRRKKRLQAQASHNQSTEETAARSAEHQAPLQAPRISSEVTAGSTPSGPGPAGPQVRNSGTCHSKSDRPWLTRRPEEGKWPNGDVTATPLKDLFKTLDAAVFHSGP